MLSSHCNQLALIALAAMLPWSTATAQQLPPVAPRLGASAPASFTIFVRTVRIGSEQVAVARSGDGWTITASGRLGTPIDIAFQRLQVRYDQNWTPLELTLDSTVRGKVFTLHSTVAPDAVTDQITEGDQSTTLTTPVRADLLLPSLFFAAPFEALAAKLRTAPAGSTFAVHTDPQLPFSIQVGNSSPDRFATATQMIEARHTHVALLPMNAPPIDAEVWSDATGRLLRVSIPLQALEIVREDIASVASRRVPISRPNDEQVRIPSNGFSLSGTVSKSAASRPTPGPAVVLIGGGGPTDRDELMFGVPILGELAGAVADAGFLTLRFDKRGVGQSGGRLESASLTDLAQDAVAAVKVLARRKDVDPKRIAVVGYSDGAAVALIAATREKQITAVALIAAAGIRGTDLVLERQRRLLNRMGLSESEKQAKVDLQTRINEAIITGKGWETLPPEAQRRTDNAEFQSILVNDPAKIIPDVRAPMLILQPELDTEVLPVNAERLDALARKRKNTPPAEVVKVPGVNHLLFPATTGETEEYGTLKDSHVSPAVSNALNAWLTKTLAAK